MPVFDNCSFVGNYQIISKKNIYTLTVLFADTFTVNFTTSTSFRNNKGTAVYVTAGSISVLESTRVVFDSNEEYQRGAIALAGFSVLRTFPNSVLIFTNNHATDVGGAIYAAFSDSIETYRIHAAVSFNTLTTAWTHITGKYISSLLITQPGDMANPFIPHLFFHALTLQHLNTTWRRYFTGALSTTCTHIRKATLPAILPPYASIFPVMIY